MSSLRLIKFECNKEITSFTFMIVIMLLTVFAITQFSEIFHLPVSSESDIQALDRSGERKYIFVSNTDKELKSNSVDFLRQIISEGTISTEIIGQLDPVIEMLTNDSYTFDDIFTVMKDDELIFGWLGACKAQFAERLGSIDEVNSNLRHALGNKGYSPNFFTKYVTYMQCLAAFLIFPIFLLLFTRDYRHNMYEIIYMQPLSSTKYILCRFCGAFIPLAVYLYLFGLILNFISIIRFVGAGYEFSYTPYITYYSFYLLPTIFFLSSLLMFLMALIKKVIAVFPIYIIYLIFSATPAVFNHDSKWIRIISPIIRLDTEIAEMKAIVINRIVYMILGIILLLFTCKFYKKLRHNLRRVINI